jgi:hypothetical protein
MITWWDVVGRIGKFDKFEEIKMRTESEGIIRKEALLEKATV